MPRHAESTIASWRGAFSSRVEDRSNVNSGGQSEGLICETVRSVCPTHPCLIFSSPINSFEKDRYFFTFYKIHNYVSL